MTPPARELPLAEWTALQLQRVELEKRSPAPGSDPAARLQELADRLDTEPAEHTSAVAAAREQLRLAEAELAAFQGRYVDVLAATDGVDTTDLGTELGIVTASVRCEALAVTGNVVRALALGKQVLAATANVPPHGPGGPRNQGQVPAPAAALGKVPGGIRLP